MVQGGRTAADTRDASARRHRLGGHADGRARQPVHARRSRSGVDPDAVVTGGALAEARIARTGYGGRSPRVAPGIGSVDVDPGTVPRKRCRARRSWTRAVRRCDTARHYHVGARRGCVGSQTWAGRIDTDAGGGDVVVTITTSGVRLNVRSSGSSIDLQPAGDGRYLLTEERRTYPREAGVEPPRRARRSRHRRPTSLRRRTAR